MSTSNAGFSALVAGGSKGIGLAIASRLAKPGATLFINYSSDETSARDAYSTLTNRGAAIHLIKADLVSAAGAERLIEEVSRKTKRLDALVHSAAVPSPGRLMTQSLESIRDSIEVGGMALLYMVRAGDALLAEGSNVLFLSGNGVDLVLPNHGALSAAKAIGECFVRYLAIECAPRGINFNTLRIGPIDTGLYREAIGVDASTQGVLTPATPNGRHLSAEDAAGVAEFLLLGSASMVRGQTILVDGGLSTGIRVR